ncbi:MAG: ParB/RepB/Spo0J family partition protein [Chloroflexi bacterium]|nr:ParB/RepB/Spo0J family partition protein [Chloroflexota bacterium]
MPKHSGLGKGLDALIPTGFQPEGSQGSDAPVISGGLLMVPVEQIVPNPRQPRSHFKEDALNELAASIKEHGIIQPLLVSRNDGDNGYTLVAGERRWQASQRAGLKEVPVIVRQTTDQQRLELALIENVQRADLNPLEEANAYRQLSDEFHLSHEEIAMRVGKSRVAVTNTLRLLNLPESVQKALVAGDITEGHARALLGLTNPRAMESALQTVLLHKLTVRQTEELVNRLKGEKPAAVLKDGPSPEEKSLEDFIRSSLSQKISVKIGKDRNSGSLTLHYGSEEEFQDLMVRLTGEKYAP